MPSVTDQVATFLNSTGPVPSRSVVVIFIGVNDIFYGGLNVDVKALTTSVLNNVKLLVARGTTHSFLFLPALNSPLKRLGYSSFVLSTRPANVFLPANANADAATVAAFKAYAKNWNANLTQSITTSHLPRNVSVKLWDWYSLIERARKAAVKQGIEVDTPCLVWTPERTVCEDPTKHLL